MEYDYACPGCGYVQTHKYKMADTKPTVIVYYHWTEKNQCRKRSLHRVFAVPSLNNVNRFGTRSARDTGRRQQ